MPTYRLPAIAPSQITDESVYFARRRILQALGFGLPLLAAGCGSSPGDAAGQASAEPPGKPLDGVKRPSAYDAKDALTSWDDATSYNNYYEFGTGKKDPARYAGGFKPRPWSVEIAGHAEVTGTFDLDDLVKPGALVERIYRHRCVEAWSMVIPWVGVPLADVLARFKPTSKARYVAFTTIARREEMPGLAYGVLDWPYREGLRIDEAMHPLAMLAVGLYGRALPNQNGAPLRLVVPWKYGFKGAKSIVRIEFTETQPRTSWNMAGPDEYGFYSNVNPAVDHPRWSQGSERRIAAGSSLLNSRVETLPFNGYADQVASLYAGMDLKANY